MTDFWKAHPPHRRVPHRRVLSRMLAGLALAFVLVVPGATAAEPWGDDEASPLSIRARSSFADPLMDSDLRAWVRLAGGVGRGGEVSAMARGMDGALAIGDDAGVSLFANPTQEDPHSDEVARAAADRTNLPAVRDLAFDARGELWIATSGGLYRWADRGRPVRRPLRGAESAPGLSAVATAGDVVVVAGESGAYWSTSGDIFQPLDVAGVGSSIDRVLLRGLPETRGSQGPNDSVVRVGGSAEVWLLGEKGLHRLRGRVTPSGFRVLGRERIELPRPRSDRAGLELVRGPAGRALALVYPDLLAVRLMDDRSSEALVGVNWHLLRPVLAPGAQIRSLSWTADRVALSTDHGVFVGTSLDGSFVRAGAPVGTRDCVESLPPLGKRPGLALCREGVYAARPIRRGAAHGRISLGVVGDLGNLGPAVSTQPVRLQTPTRRSEPLPQNPPVGEIRRRALERAGLDARRSSELWTGLRKRAFWPEVELRFQTGFDRDRHADYDQTFSTGEVRDLVDYGHDRSQRLSGAVTLDWDLGGLAYPLEAVDLSRELRQVVSLRDDVADEINQLYFERQRVRARLQAIREGRLVGEGDEVDRLTFRAREIDAGLDAWTGGWLTRWHVDHASHVPLSERPDFPVPINKEE